MKNKALQYYKKGWNCSQCILKAAESRYQIPISKQSLALCSAVNTGFGIGGMCSVLIAGIMVFGLMFDEATAKRMRIRLLTEFKSRHQSLNCSELTRERGNNSNCEELVKEIAELVENIIQDEL